MKKFFSISFFYIFFLNLIFSAEPKTINQNNEYNGITLEYNLSTDEPQYTQFTKVQVFYDNSKNKRKEIYCGRSWTSDFGRSSDCAGKY